jgi:RNA polymerase sigma-70 factor, ECF subfamily
MRMDCGTADIGIEGAAWPDAETGPAIGGEFSFRPRRRGPRPATPRSMERAARTTGAAEGAADPRAGDDADDEFERLRPLLFSRAKRMLGNAADAEDVVQEAYLRLAGVPPDRVRSRRSYLCTVVTRLCVDQLRAARVRRDYAAARGAEPVDAARAGDALDAVILAESLATGFRRLLERLTPAERVVFLLREVFAFGYPEVARVVERSEVSCRQLASRARARLAEVEPRFAVSAAALERVDDGFPDAWRRGDVPRLLTLLTEPLTVTPMPAGAQGRGARAAPPGREPPVVRAPPVAAAAR